MARLAPVIPLFGACTKFQPVYVDDIAEAAAKGASGEVEGGIFELGGPDVASFRDLIQEMLGVVRRRRLVVGFPLWMGRIAGRIFDVLSAVTGGLAPAVITYDQAMQLADDNVVSEDAKTFADLNIVPRDMEAILPEYLWIYRPDGQYNDITRSAQRLKS